MEEEGEEEEEENEERFELIWARLLSLKESWYKTVVIFDF